MQRHANHSREWILQNYTFPLGSAATNSFFTESFSRTTGAVKAEKTTTSSLFDYVPAPVHHNAPAQTAEGSQNKRKQSK